MIDTKSIFSSKGVIGGFIVVVASGFGLNVIDAPLMDNVFNNLEQIVTGIGGLLAIYGRIVASKRIG